MSYYGFRPYVPVARRKAQAASKVDKLRAKGKVIEPIHIEGRKIAKSFWGKAWYDHVEAFGDYSNRLPRGRTYVRNGSVCHLGIANGRVEALVAGSSLYEVVVRISALGKAHWEALKKKCTGQVGSLIDLLAGNLSSEVMAIVTDPKEGLLPSASEIDFSCSCPDGARMCKHVAAVIYGIGARLDDKSELLFLLRGVDHKELVDASSVDAVISGKGQRGSSRRRVASLDASAIFGIEMESVVEDALEVVPKPKKITPTKAIDKSTKAKGTVKSTKAKGTVKSTKAKGTVKSTKAKGSVKSTKAKGTAKSTRSTPAFKPTAKHVVQLRKKMALTQGDFAKRVGVTTLSISKWENALGAINFREKSLNALQQLWSVEMKN